MSHIPGDLVHALRSLRKRPGFAFAAIVTLAVGIGANITVFTIVDAILLRPLPFGERSDRVVTMHSTHQLQAEDWSWGDSEISYADFVDLRDSSSFEGLAGYLPRNFTLTDAADAERVQGASVTPGLFAVLGVQPVLGRAFLDSEAAPPGLENAVLLTHGLWQRRYGGDPGIVGRGIVVNDRLRTVVGVLPPGFRFPERDELYLPLRLDEAPRSARNLNVVGVLRTGVTVAQAQGEMDAAAARLAADYPETNRGYGLRVLAFRDSQVGASERAMSGALMAAVTFVLLIACANLANLLLVRGAGRQREAAIRAAVGASRWRLVSSTMAESVILSVAGAVTGLIASQWALDFIRQSFPEELPFWLQFHIDGRIAAFALVLSCLTAVAIGLLPGLRSARPDLTRDLKDSSRGVSLSPSAQRLQSGLAVLQVALCLALLVGANLMIRSLMALQQADLGFDHAPMLSARAYLAGDAFDDVRTRAAFFERAVQTLEALPGATAAAATSSIPGDDGGGSIRLVRDGQTTRDDEIAASSITITPGLFDALGLRLTHGRTFTSFEVADPEARVAIVNARLAARLWPGESVLDRRVGVPSGANIDWFRIVGIAPDVVYEEADEQTEFSQLTLYLPYATSPGRTMAFLVRGGNAPAALVQPMRDALRRLHPGLPLYEQLTMSERRRFTSWEQQFIGRMMGAFAAVALLLACLGVYALLAYAVRRRTHEIGVRLALGASPRGVTLLFVREGGIVAGLGLLAGLLLAAAVARALSGSMFGVEAMDPALFAGVAGALLAAVLGASYWPARRAARIDPSRALRAEG